MASRELSILVKAKGAIQAAKDIGRVNKAVGGLGSTAARGVGTAVGNIAKLGLVAAGGVAIAVKGGIESLASLESATASVDGAIKQLGLTGQLTGTQVATWANDIEANVGAAFDDKDITRATATLLRFGKVTPDNLKPAMVVMTDLATKTGDVDSAAALLAKALADPAKAAGKLARAGVILTKEQQDQIKAMVKAGDAAGAQKVLLDALAKTTSGAALASQGPYARSLSVLKDVTEDAQRALAEGFLPILEKVRSFLSTELAKPETLAKIREFGQGLAKGLGNLIDIARNLPWGAIGDALKIGGAGAKAVLDAFVGMPAWVQTAIVTGWGLNKLTGGMFTGLVGELGKGLIKGVLGMNAAVVNINAASVNGGGPGIAPKTGGGISGLIKTAATSLALIVPPALLLADTMDKLDRANDPTRTYADKYGFSQFGLTPKDPHSDMAVAGQKESDRVVRASADQTRNTLAGAIRSGDSSIVSAIRNIAFNATFNINGTRQLVRVTSGSTLSRYAGKLIPID